MDELKKSEAEKTVEYGIPTADEVKTIVEQRICSDNNIGNFTKQLAKFFEKKTEKSELFFLRPK